MSSPRIDAAALSLGLAGVGFGVVVLLSPQLISASVQPILAIILAAAGTIALLLRSRLKPTKEEEES